MADNLLKEILDSLTDVDSINLFAAANGLTGDTEVENRLREVEWNHHIDNLWEEILLDLESAQKDRDNRMKMTNQAFSLVVGMQWKRNLTTYGRRIHEHSKRIWPMTRV